MNFCFYLPIVVVKSRTCKVLSVTGRGSKWSPRFRVPSLLHCLWLCRLDDIEAGWLLRLQGTYIWGTRGRFIALGCVLARPAER
jgi:hypothetical protein